jgi:hypothetical protein
LKSWGSVEGSWKLAKSHKDEMEGEAEYIMWQATASDASASRTGPTGGVTKRWVRVRVRVWVCAVVCAGQGAGKKRRSKEEGVCVRE